MHRRPPISTRTDPLVPYPTLFRSYFGKNAVVQGGFFWKRIEDFIVDREFDADEAPYNGVFNGVPFTEALIPLNGDKATVKGLGFSYQQALTFLQAPLDGFLINFNYTYTDRSEERRVGKEWGIKFRSRWAP